MMVYEDSSDDSSSSSDDDDLDLLLVCNKRHSTTKIESISIHNPYKARNCSKLVFHESVSDIIGLNCEADEYVGECKTCN